MYNQNTTVKSRTSASSKPPRINVSSAASLNSKEISLGPEVSCPVAGRLPERSPEGGRPGQTELAHEDFPMAMGTVSTQTTFS